ncbi:hypothetical protein ACWDFR_41245 [Streptomyces sp. 900105755]
MLAWVPFLYVAIRRGRGSDWGALASFALYEAVTLGWGSIVPGKDGDAVLGVVVVLCLLTATGLLLFALFDTRTPKPQGQGYGTMAPQPVTGNPYLR